MNAYCWYGHICVGLSHLWNVSYLSDCIYTQYSFYFKSLWLRAQIQAENFNMKMCSPTIWGWSPSMRGWSQTILMCSPMCGGWSQLTLWPAGMIPDILHVFPFVWGTIPVDTLTSRDDPRHTAWVPLYVGDDPMCSLCVGDDPRHNWCVPLYVGDDPMCSPLCGGWSQTYLMCPPL